MTWSTASSTRTVGSSSCLQKSTMRCRSAAVAAAVAAYSAVVPVVAVAAVELAVAAGSAAWLVVAGPSSGFALSLDS